jgi:hypothetical protein
MRDGLDSGLLDADRHGAGRRVQPTGCRELDGQSGLGVNLTRGLDTPR